MSLPRFFAGTPPLGPPPTSLRRVPLLLGKGQEKAGQGQGPAPLACAPWPIILYCPSLTGEGVRNEREGFLTG